MNKIITVIMLATLLGLAGCKNKGSVNSNGMPKTLIIGVVETEKIDQVKQLREKIRKYLQTKLGMPVELIATTDYVGLIEALKAKKVHVAQIPPFAYVIATRTIKLTPLVTLGTNGKPVTYQSVLIVKGNSKLNSMADVKANAKKLTFCFVDPASTSGHLVPRGYLTSIGINPDTAFKQTIFAGSHMASILSVKSGKIDVGCTTDMIFGLMTKAKMLNPGDVKVLWKSAPIVSDPIVVRDDINKDLAKKIQQAYLDIARDDPSIIEGYNKMLFHDKVTRTFIIAQDSSFNGLRKIAASIKDLKAN